MKHNLFGKGKVCRQTTVLEIYLAEEAKHSTAADVTATEQIVSELLHCAAVERLVLTEETGKQAEVGAVGTSMITSYLIHRQCVTAIDLGARRTTHHALGLHTVDCIYVEIFSSVTSFSYTSK